MVTPESSIITEARELLAGAEDEDNENLDIFGIVSTQLKEIKKIEGHFHPLLHQDDNASHCCHSICPSLRTILPPWPLQGAKPESKSCYCKMDGETEWRLLCM